MSDHATACPPGTAPQIPLPAEQPLMDFGDVFPWFRMGRTLAYDLAADGKFPIEVLRHGRNMQCRTSDVRRYLGISQ